MVNQIMVKRKARELVGSRPGDGKELAGWVEGCLGVEVPYRARCVGHCAPIDYLARAFFGDGDALVWANRGGGKTLYAAIATLLDLLYKPSIQVRILGGSRDQSDRMYEYLRRFFERPYFRSQLKGRPTRDGLTLLSGSHVQVLAQSQTSVRGHHVQKVRCDEVELFDPEVWRACQFTTKSKWCGAVFVPGSVEALSTMHKRFGLMKELVESSRAFLDATASGGSAQSAVAIDGAPRSPRPAPDAEPTCAGRGAQLSSFLLFPWCAYEVMARCPAGLPCEPCAIRESCGGKAKKFRGFFRAEDVVAIRGRSSRQSFEAEMLCRYAGKTDAVYPDFDPAVHVREMEADRRLTWVAGMDFGMRDPTVVLWGQLRPVQGSDGATRLEILDEYTATDLATPEHLQAMEERGWPGLRWIGVDPAGRQRQMGTGLSTLDLLRQRGYRVRWRVMGVAQGIDRVRRYLDVVGSDRARERNRNSYSNGPITSYEHEQEGTPLLVIHPRCRNLIKSLSEYHFNPDDPRDESPVKDGADHACDALRYLVTNMETWGRSEFGEY